jgi:hypothetical protein
VSSTLHHVGIRFLPLLCPKRLPFLPSLVVRGQTKFTSTNSKISTTFINLSWPHLSRHSPKTFLRPTFIDNSILTVGQIRVSLLCDITSQLENKAEATIELSASMSPTPRTNQLMSVPRYSSTCLIILRQLSCDIHSLTSTFDTDTCRPVAFKPGSVDGIRQVGSADDVWEYLTGWGAWRNSRGWTAK